MKKTITTSEVAILGLLSEGASHGYELDQLIDKRGMRQWTSIGFSSIYYLLSKLESRGLVKAKKGAKKGAKSTRQVYALSAKGKKTLVREVERSLEGSGPVHNPLCLALCNMNLLEHKQIQEKFCGRLKALEERKADVESTMKRQRPVPWNVELLFEFSLSQIAAEITWLKKAIQKVPNSNAK